MRVEVRGHVDTLPYISPMGWGCPLWPENGCWSKSIQGTGSGLELYLLFILLQGPLGSTWDSYSREGRLTKQDSRYPPWIAPVVSPSCIPVPGSLERSGAQCCPLGAQVPGEYVWKGCPSRPDIQEVSQPGQGCGILRPSSIHGGDKQNIPE